MKARILFTLALLGITLPQAAASEFTFDHENVLGTSLHLRVEAESVEAAQAVEATVLREVDRLGQLFSTYDAQSELSRFLALPVGARVEVSADMAAMMRAAANWQRRTESAFHPGAESLFELWRTAGRDGRLPAPEAIQARVDALRRPAWFLVDDVESNPPFAERTSAYRFSFNAIAEGYILDRVVERVRREHQPASFLINLGGEVVGFGQAYRVGVRDPRGNDADATPLTMLTLAGQAMSTSGGYRRGWTIGGRHYSHVIDPRTGQPVEHALSTTVVARTATDADALATALHVLPVADALALADALDGVACLIVDRDSQVRVNRHWLTSFGPPQGVAPVTATALADEAPAWNGGKELAVSLQINQPANAGRYRRPYVAVWVEDKDGYPVKTLALWVQSTGPGPRWIPDLRRWYKSDGLRRVADPTDLVKTVSEATRKPGAYQLVWNGKDDLGQLVEAGDYTIYIESAREHGTYQLIKQPLKIGAAAFKHTPAGNAEIKDAVIEYRDRKPASK